MTRNLLSRHRSFSAITLAWLAAVPAPLRAADFAEWKFRQALRVEAAGVVTFAVPPETLDAARADRGDLRLLDPAGREVAFALAAVAAPVAAARPAKSFRAALTATATQLVIETGDAASPGFTLVTPTPRFVKRARIETSDDGRAWQIAAEGALLFREAGAAELGVRAPAAFVRVTLDDTRSPPVPFTGATILPITAAAPSDLPLGVRIARRDEFAGETVLTLELAAARTPLANLRFATDARLFNRRVTVGIRALVEEDTIERTLASGTIYRLAPDGEAEVRHTRVPLDFAPPTRELIVHIANGDSPPLAITSVEVTRRELRGHFDAAAPGDYALLSGHTQVAAPRYDVATLRLGARALERILTPGPLTPNPAYRAPETLAGVALAGAALDTAPWRFRKAVRVATAGVQQLELDLDVLAQAQRGLGDVRLVRDGAQVPFLLERPNLSRALELTAKPADDPKRPRVSRWEIALPRTGLPLTRLTLSSPTALFQRQLRLFELIADDRGNRHERTLASAEWSHTPENKGPLTLALSTPPTSTALVLETENGDNPPITLSGVTVAHPVARLLFKSDTTPVALYYGHAGAAAPRYDLALVASQILAATKEAATLGPEEPTSVEAWPARVLRGGNSILFWGALALVVAVLLSVVAKLLPKPPAA
ncbi:MAG: DUF3999 family protein [Opitutaceae bacterium]|nr:DUF3999 family protein [Opitutaceae bacterium]